MKPFKTIYFRLKVTPSEIEALTHLKEMTQNINPKQKNLTLA